jgi:hypothetical protein
MAERSGYEIRENLLHLAHETVRQNAMMTMEATRSKVDGKPIVDWKGFSAEDVIATAEKLNIFVTTK